MTRHPFGWSAVSVTVWRLCGCGDTGNETWRLEIYECWLTNPKHASWCTPRHFACSWAWDGMIFPNYRFAQPPDFAVPFGIVRDYYTNQSFSYCNLALIKLFKLYQLQNFADGRCVMAYMALMVWDWPYCTYALLDNNGSECMFYHPQCKQGNWINDLALYIFGTTGTVNNNLKFTSDEVAHDVWDSAVHETSNLGI